MARALEQDELIEHWTLFGDVMALGIRRAMHGEFKLNMNPRLTVAAALSDRRLSGHRLCR